MDPVTQGLLGSAAAMAVFAKPLGRRAALIGLVGGVVADTDVWLAAWSDPAHPQEFHRHFTHALAFIPVGGVLAALPFFARQWYRDRAKWVVCAATLAYATHGLLDCCTSYGTHWYWPISNARLSWDLISIIDPIFTGTLLMAVVWSVVRNRGRPAVVGLILASFYMGWGAVQHGRAVSITQQIAEHRGHAIERMRVMPTFGNLIVWRALYMCDRRIYSAAVRTPLLGSTTVREGGSVAIFDPEHLPWGWRIRTAW